MKTIPKSPGPMSRTTDGITFELNDKVHFLYQQLKKKGVTL